MTAKKWTAREIADMIGPVASTRESVIPPQAAKLSSHDAFLKLVAGALRQCINDHGPITTEWTGSAAKRVIKQCIAVGIAPSAPQEAPARQLREKWRARLNGQHSRNSITHCEIASWN